MLLCYDWGLSGEFKSTGLVWQYINKLITICFDRRIVYVKMYFSLLNLKKENTQKWDILYFPTYEKLYPGRSIKKITGLTVHFQLVQGTDLY